MDIGRLMINRNKEYEGCLYFLMDVSETGLLDRGERFTLHEGKHTHDFEWLEFESLQMEAEQDAFLKGYQQAKSMGMSRM